MIEKQYPKKRALKMMAHLKWQQTITVGKKQEPKMILEPKKKQTLETKETATTLRQLVRKVQRTVVVLKKRLRRAKLMGRSLASSRSSRNSAGSEEHQTQDAQRSIQTIHLMLALAELAESLVGTLD